VKQYRVPLAGAVLLGLAACGGGDNNTPPLTGAIRVANGISDSTGLDMSITDTTSFSAIAVDSASSIKYIPVSAVVSYKATLTTNGSSFTVDGISADQDKLTTVFAFGEMSSGTQGGFPAEMSVNSPANGQFVMQPVHAALQTSAAALSLNFYFVKPGVCSTAVTGATANGSATFKASPALFALAGGTYEICVTDGAGTVLFDSGPTGIALPTSNANVFQIAAYDAPSGKGNGSTLMLSLVDNAGGNVALYNLKN
jgi:hypothetical protein